MAFQGGIHFGAANFRVSDKENRERVKKTVGYDARRSATKMQKRQCTLLAALAGLLEPLPQKDRQRVH